jgi:RNA polymerase sigma factor (sigma-70 family)
LAQSPREFFRHRDYSFMGALADPSTSPTLLARLGLPDRSAAWATFVRLYGPVIGRYCREAGLSADDGEEVQARVLAALVTALGGFKYDPARRFRGYLRTAVDNAVGRLWKERARRPGDRATGSDAERDRLAGLEARDPFAGLANEIEADLHARLRLADVVVGRVRDIVDPTTWEAFRLTAIEGVPAATAAAQLGKSVGAVYMAKSRVGKLLKAEGERALESPPDAAESS